MKPHIAVQHARRSRLVWPRAYSRKCCVALKTLYVERCPSGRRSTTGNRVSAKTLHGFKSHPLRCLVSTKKIHGHQVLTPQGKAGFLRVISESPVFIDTGKQHSPSRSNTENCWGTSIYRHRFESLSNLVTMGQRRRHIPLSKEGCGAVFIFLINLTF